MKRLPFWLICILVLFGALVVGGYAGLLFMRIAKDGRRWKELRPPPGEKVAGLLDTIITTDKEHLLCAIMESGSVYLWQSRYEPWVTGMLDLSRTPPNEHWHLLKPLPDSGKIHRLILLGFGASLKEIPLVVAKSDKGGSFAWKNDGWQPFEKITRFGQDWPLPWPADDDTNILQLLVQTNNAVNAKSTSFLADYRKPQKEFSSWFTLRKPPGKVVDETKVSFEGALSWWVSDYVLLEDGRLFVLATETDFIDAAVELAGAAVGFVIGVILLVVLGVRRKRANARRPKAVTS
jgi:hypothetical protein